MCLRLPSPAGVPALCRSELSSPLRLPLHDAIRRLVSPKLKVRLPTARLADLPRHPGHAQFVEYSDVRGDLIGLLGARCAELLEQHQLVGGEGVIEGDATLLAELGHATVGMHIDNFKGRAGPVLGDVGVGEFVASACVILSVLKGTYTSVEVVDFEGELACGDENTAFAHDAAHELGSIAPP